MLTQDQIDHFHTFGFLVLRQLLTQVEAARMKREAEQMMDEIHSVFAVKMRNYLGVAVGVEAVSEPL